MRKTKRLVEFEGVACEMGERRLFSDLNFILTAGSKVGLVGPNGSGKTTLLRLLRGEVEPVEGSIRRADTRKRFDLRGATLRRALPRPAMR